MSHLAAPSDILLLTAAALHAVGYVLYTHGAVRGTNQPNTTSWAVWTFFSLISGVSYFGTTHHSIESAQFIAGSVFCIGSFAVMLGRGKFQRISRSEVVYLIIGVIAACLLGVFHKPGCASIIVSLTIATSFGPMFRALWGRKMLDNPCPWWLWTVAYLITISVAIIQGADWWSVRVISPVILLIPHLAVAILLIRRISALESSNPL